MEPAPATPDAERDPGLRTLGRVGAVGGVVAVLVAVVVGVAAGSGRSALAMLLLVGALTSAVTGLVGAFTLLRDEHRGDVRPSRARIVVTVSAFLGTTLLLAMVVGVASGA